MSAMFFQSLDDRVVLLGKSTVFCACENATDQAMKNLLWLDKFLFYIAESWTFNVYPMSRTEKTSAPNEGVMVVSVRYKKQTLQSIVNSAYRPKHAPVSEFIKGFSKYLLWF